MSKKATEQLTQAMHRLEGMKSEMENQVDFLTNIINQLSEKRDHLRQQIRAIEEGITTLKK